MEYLVPLWEHQKKAIELSKSQPSFALFMETGTGKTATLINILRTLFTKNKRIGKTLIFSPPITLSNWYREWGVHSKIQDQVCVLKGSGAKRLKDFLKGDKKIYITNYEALLMEPLFEAFLKWEPEVLVGDECFLPETLVDTPGGPRPIKDLKVGDLVFNAVGVGRVKNCFKKEFNGGVLISYSGVRVGCTTNHLWLTQRGWVKAKDLKKGDTLVSTEKAVRALQEIFSEQEKEISFLFEILQREVDTREYGCGPENIKGPDREEESRQQCSHEEKQSNAQPSGEEENDSYATPNKAQTKSSWWKWLWPHPCGKSLFKVLSPQMGLELTHTYFRKKWVRIPHLLQSRLWKPYKKSSYRDRWIQPQLTGSEKTRLKKAEEIKEIRVENVSFQQSTSSSGRDYYYDIEVSGHPSFSVNGVLVHNSHKIKDIKARRTKQFILLSDTAKHKYLLTGTPVLNTPMDIFSQFRALDGGETFGKNFFAFRATYFYDANSSMPRDRYFPNWKIRPGAIEEINEKIYTKAYRVRKEECLDLPPLVKQVHEVELSPEQAKAYEEMKQDFITTIRGETCVATLAITKALKLMQIVSGFVNAEKASVRMKWTPRQLALQELLETLCVEHKVLVWAVFKENYRQVSEVCAALKLKFVEVHGDIPEKEREEAVKNFQKDPDTKVFIGHPGSGGIGINLVEASYSIWYSRNFSLEQDIQAEARNYRAGSEQHTKITRIDLVARGTIDEEITKRLANKQSISDRVLQEIASLI